MATDFSTNVTPVKGGIKPTSKDTPLDIRTRIESLSEVESIPAPFISMIFYVIETGIRYEVLSLKNKRVGLTTTQVIDQYRPLPYAYTDAVNAQIAELQRQIDLKANSGDVLSREEIEELIRQNAGGSGDCGFTSDYKNAIENELISNVSYKDSIIKFESKNNKVISQLEVTDSSDIEAIMSIIKG